MYFFFFPTSVQDLLQLETQIFRIIYKGKESIDVALEGLVFSCNKSRESLS